MTAHRPVTRWVWFVVALAVSTALLLRASQASQPVYYTQVNLRFLPPANNPGNVLVGYSDSLIHFAGLVERTVNGNHTPARFSSPTAPLYGRGIRDGHSVVLIDHGGQWRTNFNTPALSVEVVAETEIDLRTKLQKILSQIADATTSAQESLHVPDERQITTSLSPSAPVVQIVQGQPLRALGGAMAVATLLSLAGLRAARHRTYVPATLSDKESAKCVDR